MYLLSLFSYSVVTADDVTGPSFCQYFRFWIFDSDCLICLAYCVMHASLNWIKYCLLPCRLHCSHHWASLISRSAMSEAWNSLLFSSGILLPTLGREMKTQRSHFNDHEAVCVASSALTSMMCFSRLVNCLYRIFATGSLSSSRSSSSKTRTTMYP